MNDILNLLKIIGRICYMIIAIGVLAYGIYMIVMIAFSDEDLSSGSIGGILGCFFVGIMLIIAPPDWYGKSWDILGENNKAITDNISTEK